jgi:Pirin C-terminal cupin domain
LSQSIVALRRTTATRSCAIVLGGLPIREPVETYEPCVMNARAELAQAIGWVTCTVANMMDAVMVGLPGATQHRLPADVPGTDRRPTESSRSEKRDSRLDKVSTHLRTVGL